MNIATPGVYVKEISKFPPSVAAVETAIPAFIGYTQFAIKKGEDLTIKPTRVTSLLEYETYFGSAENETTITAAVVDDQITATAPTQTSPFIMYYMMQLYFANGGGPCYIVSVGDYSGSVTQTELANGLSAVELVDEPTLLVFPDGTSLPSEGDFYGLYNLALTQCNKLQDRFTIMDTYTSSDVATDAAALRAGVSLSNDFLKYGAAYYPYLETILDFAYDEGSVGVTITITDSDDLRAQALAMTTGLNLSTFNGLVTDIGDLKTTVSTTSPAADALLLKPNVAGKMNEIIAEVEALITKISKIVALGRKVKGAETETNSLDTWLTDELESDVLSVKKARDELYSAGTRAAMITAIDALDSILTGGSSLDSKITTAISNAGVIDDLVSALPSGGTVVTNTTLSALKTSNSKHYNNIKAEIGLLPLQLPPSTAVAGVYAKVDRTRGIWKAPANVGLNFVQKPSISISNDQQDGLNIDATSGKSINAIRSFTGKGTLVWGARTLAGNDNEWRYVPVRRFFNFVEESVKKATEQFVFEPNDANTWVKVKAMIENFLTNQWRDGALAGSKPEHAFYVNIGLGETMTAQDILEGKMVVEIGMAAVRPAEFIILKFSHKMQES